MSDINRTFTLSMSIEKQLEELKNLRDKELISASAYDEQVSALLNKISHSNSNSDKAPPANPYGSINSEAAPKGSRMAQLYPGDKLGEGSHQFQLVKKIGSGGMGVVWEAIDLSEADNNDAAHVALKMLPIEIGAKATDLKRLRQEAQRARKLSHPNIVNVYGWHEDPTGILFLEMEYLSGHSLDQLLADKGTPGLSLQHTIELLKPVAAALDHAWQSENLVHRDLKPGNVMQTAQGQIKVLDFGLSAIARSSSAGSVLVEDRSGTAEYMPQEARRRHKVKPSWDVYSLAVMAYELLESECPWPAEMAINRQAEKQAKDWPQQPQALNDEQWAALKHSLSYEVEDRPETGAAVIAALELKAAIKPEPLPEPKKAPKPKPNAEGKRSLLPIILIIASVLLGGWYLFNNNKAEPVKPAVIEDVVDNSETEQQTKLARQKAALAEQKKQQAAEDKRIKQKTLAHAEAEEKAAQKKVALKQAQLAAEAKRTAVAQLENLTGKMVVIPSGRFMMGSNEGAANEKPPHFVNIASFKMSQTEVTVAQWDACVVAGGCEYNSNYRRRDDSPIVDVSYNDITQQYIPWLNKETGKTYRLPTEAEWEYAARAKSGDSTGHKNTKYSWGNSIDCTKASYDGGKGSACYHKKSDGSYRGTAAVKSYAANAFGLYDMHGNAQEWTQDCWNASYKGVPNDGSAWMAGDCENHVLRGGSWLGVARPLRSAYRHKSDSKTKITYGFRLVQSR